MLFQNTQLDFVPLSSLSSRAMASNGHVDVNLPRATWQRAEGFLADFGLWLQSIGFGTWSVNKEAGHHLTDFWLHARMDSSAPAKSQVLKFVFCNMCCLFPVGCPDPTHPPTPTTILHESHASRPHSCLGVEVRDSTPPPHPRSSSMIISPCGPPVHPSEPTFPAPIARSEHEPTPCRCPQ